MKHKTLPNPNGILIFRTLKVKRPRVVGGYVEKVTLFSDFFGESVMWLFVTGNLHQQRISFIYFKLLYKTFQGGRLKSYSRYVEYCLSQVSKGQYFLWSSASVAFSYHFIDMAPGSHVLGSIIYSSLPSCKLLLLVRPAFRWLFFLIVFVIGEQMIHNRLPAYSIFVANDFEGS